MEKDQKEQKYKFTKEEREKILKETFKVGRLEDKCEKRSLEAIIDGIIDAIKNGACYNDRKDCIRKYWFTKQIEEENKDDNNKNELMEIVREDLKIRIANTMLVINKVNMLSYDTITMIYVKCQTLTFFANTYPHLINLFS